MEDKKVGPAWVWCCFDGAVSCESAVVEAYYLPKWGLGLGLGDMSTLPVCEFGVAPDDLLQ